MKKKMCICATLITIIKTATEENTKKESVRNAENEKNMKKVTNNLNNFDSFDSFDVLSLSGVSTAKHDNSQSPNSTNLDHTLKNQQQKQSPLVNTCKNKKPQSTQAKPRDPLQTHNTKDRIITIWDSVKLYWTIKDCTVNYSPKKPEQKNWRKPQNRPWHVIKDKFIAHYPIYFEDLFERYQQNFPDEPFLLFCQLFEGIIDKIYEEIATHHKNRDLAKIQGFDLDYIKKHKSTLKNILQIPITEGVINKIHDLLIKIINPNKLTQEEWKQGLCSKEKLFNLYGSPCGLPLPDYMLAADGSVVLTESKFPYMR